MTPLNDKAKARYQGSQGRQYHEGKRGIPDEAFPWVARLRAGKIAAEVELNDTVLEYGVGSGWNLAGLSCRRRIGMDVSEFLEPFVRQHGIEFVSRPEQLSDESIDVVICHHVLEHVSQPDEVLATVHRVLRANGHLLVFVPYEKERRFQYFDPTEPNHHLYSWNVQTLGNLVSEAGFAVRRAGLGRFGQERFAARWAARFRLGERGFRLLHWVANRLKHEFEVRVVAQKVSGID